MLYVSMYFSTCEWTVFRFVALQVDLLLLYYNKPVGILLSRQTMVCTVVDNSVTCTVNHVVIMEILILLPVAVC